MSVCRSNRLQGILADWDSRVLGGQRPGGLGGSASLDLQVQLILVIFGSFELFLYWFINALLIGDNQQGTMPLVCVCERCECANFNFMLSEWPSCHWVQCKKPHVSISIRTWDIPILVFHNCKMSFVSFLDIESCYSLRLFQFPSLV